MPQLIGFHFVWDRRSWSNQAHVAQQDVQKLWHFVEARTSQQFSDSRDAGIGEDFVSRLTVVADVRFSASGDERFLVFAVKFRVSARFHCAKFVEEEQAAVHTDAFLCVKNRTS